MLLLNTNSLSVLIGGHICFFVQYYIIILTFVWMHAVCYTTYPCKVHNLIHIWGPMRL
jgi:hypothetical protein